MNTVDGLTRVGLKPLNEAQYHSMPNAWGTLVTSGYQKFEVTEACVGIELGDYRGQGYSSYKFKASDVGRTVQVVTCYWQKVQCWTFI